MDGLWTLVVGVLLLCTNTALALRSDTPLPDPALRRILDHTVDGRRVTGAVVCLRQGEREFLGAAGDLQPDRPFFIASTTKLYTAAIVLRLVEQGRLGLDTPLGGLLPDSLLTGLHTLKGRESGPAITVRQLLSQTSGLPDYFSDRARDGTSLERELLEGRDRSWTAGQALGICRTMQPPFVPEQPGKAHYSDTNYQLLGLVIERVTGRTYSAVLHEEILDPLGLERTWLAGDPPPAGLAPVAPLRCGKGTLEIPRAMASFGPDGGLIATAGDLQNFLRAFFRGGLFPQERLTDLQHWNRIFFPFRYGTGLMEFRVPRVFSPFKAFPALVGHSGLSGAFAFYCPERDLFLSGTVNQIRKPGTSFRLMLKLIQAIERHDRKSL